MTREEAIKYAQKELETAYKRAEKIGHKGKTRYIEVLEMAIKALEQEPCKCFTCKYGEWKRKGWDITMADDKCGGCCSWNDKYEPLEQEPKTDILDKIRAIVKEWEDDSWTDGSSYECMIKISELFEKSEG